MTIKARHILAVSVVIAGVLLVLTLSKPDPLSPEAGINATIDAGVAALEAGDSDAVMDLISDDFRGNISSEGTLDRAGLGRYVGLYLLRQGGVSVNVITRSIDVRGETEGTATLRVVGVRGGLQGALAGDVDAEQVRLELQLEGGDWLITSASR